jgi:transcriptional regulator with XRE-family HTH domain
MTKIERIRKLCKWLIYIGYADNDAELASKLGYTKSSFSQIMNEKVPLSDKFIDKICAADKNINKVWINTGSGDIHNDGINGSMNLNEPTPGYNTTTTEVVHLKEKLKIQEEQIHWFKNHIEFLTEQLSIKNVLDKQRIQDVFERMNEIEKAAEKKSVR